MEELPKILGEDEYLLKVRPGYPGQIPTGFMTKYTQRGELPKVFKEWGVRNVMQSTRDTGPYPISVHTETFRSGWRIYSWRFGMSQNWAVMVHPMGFTVEIYMTNLMEVLLSTTSINGVLIDEFKWKDNKLIKKMHNENLL